MHIISVDYFKLIPHKMDKRQKIILAAIIAAVIAVIVVIIVIVVATSSDSSEGTSYGSIYPGRPVIYPVNPSSYNDDEDDGGTTGMTDYSGMSDYNDTTDYSGMTDYDGTSDYGGMTGMTDYAESVSLADNIVTITLSTGNILNIDLSDVSCKLPISDLSINSSDVSNNDDGTLRFDISVNTYFDDHYSCNAKDTEDECIEKRTSYVYSTFRVYSDDASSGECTYEDWRSNSCSCPLTIFTS